MADSVNEDTTSKSSLKRPRPVISCCECRRKKLKCSRTHPCQQCLKVGKADVCSFQAGQEPEHPKVAGSVEPSEKRSRMGSPLGANGLSRVDQHATRTGPASSPAASIPSIRQAGMGLIEQLQQRIANLENAVGVPRRNIGLNGSHDPRPDTYLSHRTPAPSRPRQSMPSGYSSFSLKSVDQSS